MEMGECQQEGAFWILPGTKGGAGEAKPKEQMQTHKQQPGEEREGRKDSKGERIKG